MRFILIFTILLYVISLNAKQIQIPSDYSDIQSGIDAANNGDTVFVLPGHYKENIDFKGKNIKLTSNYIFSNNYNDILQTIIDGDRRGSTVTIDKR